MLKRGIIAVVAIFVFWQVFDFALHGLVLAGTYQETAELWRPEAEMKMGLMALVSLIYSVCFVALYAILIAPKSTGAGVKYGLLYGIAGGLGMGFGTYCYMPIPLSLALIWFGGTVVEFVVSGLILGAIMGPGKESI